MMTMQQFSNNTDQIVRQCKVSWKNSYSGNELAADVCRDLKITENKKSRFKAITRISTILLDKVMQWFGHAEFQAMHLCKIRRQKA